MKKKRLIPILLLRNGVLVQSKSFSRYQNLGNPITSVKRMSEWASDELMYIDISRDDVYDMGRDDLGHENHHTIFDILQDVSKHTFMPITVGGKIRSIEHIEKRLSCGADKVVINTAACERPAFMKEASTEFGAQCIVVSIDAKKTEAGYRVYSHGGSKDTGMDVVSWVKQVEQMGAGEILINSIDRDGMKQGYDIDLLRAVTESVSIPVIACGGVGEWAHFAEALDETTVDAVAAANIFQYSDQSVFLAKEYLFDHGYKVRKPTLFSVTS